MPIMINYHHLKEGLRFFVRAQRIKRKGIRKYSGKPEEICQKIVRNCYNGFYFQTSAGHFCEFYTRDFAFCAQSLISLGYQKEVYKTLQYALNIFSKNNKITTTITPDNIPIDVFSYAADSLPLLLWSLRMAEADDLVYAYKPFLEFQAEHFKKTVFSDKFGIVYPKKRFSSMKDHSSRRSACYDNCMVAMLSDDLDHFKLMNPFKDYEIKRSIESVRKDKLDLPMPLKYTSTVPKHFKKSMLGLFAGNYEGTTNWIHLGLCYMDVVAKVDKDLLKTYLHMYEEKIEKYRNFIELFDSRGRPYKTFFYHADDSMIWAAKYLYLKKKI